ncbi:threonine--tRNA ligase [Pseudenhygromyxa sp. WMMC2535]|uniref:threonine--tRNA ligase n=1 Tax=Pseudenhygromyxa sp. WMMC2535 TaxID=2712867 RepID=UPI0015540327|nr:threonine--tRNA ligase [Pseudenhygromyxa sp. WMMC2535]NVB41699.1 threonine--tRNA ligase [Pseudenhygromyxa sp. WMMC2535]
MSSEHDQEIAHMIDPTVPELSKLETMRHSAAHVMADAIKQLWPAAKLAFGPHTEDGFYYDIEMSHRLSPDDFPAIEEKMQEIVKGKHPFVCEAVERDAAVELFQAANETFKVEAISSIPEGAPLTLYRSGDFVDLCRGPHVENTGQIRAFKLLRVAGAYWRGDEKGPMLQRLYGTAFPDKKQLKKYLADLEEAKKRDHRKLGVELGLFHFDPIAPASPFFTQRGATIYNLLQEYVRGLYRKYDYGEVITPQIFDMDLFRTSGHYDHYKDNMFACEIDEREFGVKPMNCPAHCVLYRQSRHSYRELPIRMADFGRLHRYERAGVTHGLTRVRTFCQDDAHVFCRVDQLEDEIEAVTKMILETYEVFGFEDVEIEISTRPESYLGELETWERAEQALAGALERQNIDYKINAGDGAFYGPKIDFGVRDALRRPWQLGTCQLDFQLPERFGLEYVDSDDARSRPVMIHRAMLGSLERFFGVYLEHTAGKFPTWLAPVQIAILPITDAHQGWADEVEAACRAAGLRVETDRRSEKLGLKIREATLMRVPYMLVLGDKEVEARAVAPRSRDGKTGPAEALADFVERISAEGRVPA